MWSPERNFDVSSKENIEAPSTPSHGKWYGPCTPQTDRRSGSPRESPRLSLTMFAKTPRISFGKVKIGRSKVKGVVIENPLSIAQSLHLDKWPESKGFTILQPVEHGRTFQNSDVLERSVEFIIPGMSEMDLPIMWMPNAEGSYRELVTLNLGDFNRLNLILFGNAVDPAAKPKPKMKTLLPEDIRKGAGFSSQKRKISKTEKQPTSSVKAKRILRESNAGLPEPKPSLDVGASVAMVVKPIIKSENKRRGKNLNTSRKFKAKVTAKGVAPSRLTLSKHLTTESSLPRHPLPYAAKNMYYDEKWMEKQERGFVQWLNYVLTPPDELATGVQSESLCIFSNHETTGRQQHLAPTKEVLSLRAYTARRKMARLRRSACLLYQSQPVAFVAKTIEGEVEKNRLSIRADKHFHQDLGIKETMVKMLLSYNSLWLRVGLETIYGEVLPLQSNNDIMGLKRFLKKRFLANPDIVKEYRHATVAESYRPGYYEALKKFTLKKFLLLILFLDKAKLTRLIDHDPCLFNKDAEFKSSRLLLLSFSRDYLKGEGDVTKHLGLLNYIVTHDQLPLDEMDYAVTNLAVDLRDGLRITRVLELLTQNWSLSASLRVPAISRLQKVHNVDVALSALKGKGILSVEELNSVNPRHIVDGHREKTLSLLWMIILHFQVNQVVNEQQIKDEIAFLKKYHVQRNAHCKEAIVEHKDDVYSKSKKLGLLLEWCRSVCRLFGVKVDNFTVSMSDGRVMCYLLHYYHPSLLREDDIRHETTQTCNPYTSEEDSIDDDSLNAKDKSLAQDQDESSPRLGQLKENERRNYELLREKVKELGGVPSMLRFTDLSCTIPDEKVIITYISYLCSRLLDLRLEGRAARIIQLAWRKYREDEQAREIKRKNQAASVIQTCVMQFLEKKRQKAILRSTIIIQAYVRGYKARRDLRHRQHAVAVIQSHYRAYRVTQETRREFANLKRATLRMQSLYRGKIARRHVWRIKAARVIQSQWRGYLARRQFLARKRAAIVLQAEVRKLLAKHRYQRLKTATVIVQRRYRAKLLAKETRSRFINLRKVITSLQAICRGNIAREEVKRLKAAIVIQKSVKMWRCRKEFLRSKKLITKLQGKVRGNIAKKRYKELVCAVVVIQEKWKAYRLGVVERKAYRQLKTSAVVIQSYYRKYIARKQYLARRRAVILTQACVRGFIARKEIKRRENACGVIQRYFRADLLMRKAAEDYRKMKDAAIYLQALWRGRTARLRFKQQNAAIVSAQARIRGCLVRKRYLRTKSAVIALQVRYRALKQMRNQRQAYRTTRDAIITLQAALRGHRVRQELKRMTSAATRIQTAYRCYHARARYLHLKQCVYVIQRQYRAWSLGRQVALEYRRTRDAVVVIQKYTRGMAVRREVSRMTQAAVKIQANFKRYHQKKAHLALRVATINIQTRFRATRISHTARKDYLVKRQSVIRLQSALRGAICVRQYERQKQAAMVLQTRWRAVLCARKARVEYQCIRGSVITIQAFARGLRARKEVKRERAAIKIQARWRCMVQKMSYQKTRDTTVKLQACFRMLVAKRKYETLKCTVVYLQRLVRANQLCRRQTNIYHTKRDAVITLQAAVRGYCVRKELEIMNNAATRIHASFRRYTIRQEYLKTHRSAIVIQQRRRATMLCRQAKTEYQSLRSSALFLQSQVRGFVARKNFQESRRRIVLLQSAVRRIQARNNYLRMREAVLTIQERYRAYVEGCAVRKLYHLERGACITLQACIRAWICRRRYQQFRKAVKIIQVYCRATVCAKEQRQEYLVIRRAVMTIQSFTRGWFARRAVREYRAATSIQSWWRMYVARERYAHQRRCVIRLQSLVRMWSCRRRYLALQEAVVTVQTRFRANLLCRKEKDLFEEMKGSCFMIQHCYRFYRQRRLVKKMRESVSTLRNAALVLQRRYRANQLAKSTRHDYLNLRTSIIFLQAAYRGYQARVLVAKLRAAIVLQSHYRGYRQRSEYNSLKTATIKMQALTRGKQTCQKFKELRAAAVVIQIRQQARMQGHLQRRIFLTQKNSAVLIQSFYRGYRARSQHQKLRQAAIKIQSFVRGRIARKAYLNLRKAVIVIQTRERARKLGLIQRSSFLVLKKYTVFLQSRFRGRRERTRFLEKKNAAIQLQALARGKRARGAFERTRKAAMVLQRRERARVMGKTQRETFLKQRRDIILIQSIVRSQQQRTRYLELRHALITIQAHVRGKATRNHFERLRAAAIVLQRRERARVIGKRTREEFLTKRKSAILIQSCVRGYQHRSRYCKLRHATIVVQARIRQKQARDVYQQTRAAAIVIQRRERARVLGKLQKEKFQQQRRSAILIQSTTRCYQQRTRYLQLKHATILVQARTRQKQTRNVYQQTRAAAIVIQRRERARVLGKLQKEKFQQQRRSAILIQSTTRCYQQRIRYLQLKHATIVVQARIRQKQTRDVYQKTRAAAIVIQRRERARVLGKLQKEKFQQQRRSAILIQSTTRCYQQRTRYLQLKHATIVVQARTRQKQTRNVYQQTRAAAIVIQRRERVRVLGKLQKEKFQQQRRSAILIQSITRCYQQRTRYIQLKHATTIVQAHVRGKRAFDAYQKLRQTAVVIQRRERAKMLGKMERELFLTKRRCAVLIQSWVRGTRERREYHRLRNATTTIQAFVRGYQQRKKYGEIKSATLCIQERYRAYTLGREVLGRYQGIKNATVIIQSYYRGYCARQFVKRIQASIIIQAAYRRYTARLRYLCLRKATFYVQSIQRMKPEQRRYEELRNTTINLQRRVKANQLGRRVKVEYLETRNNIIQLQALWRGLKARETVRRIKSAQVIQRRYRACVEGRRVRVQFVLVKTAVISMQACYRGNVARQQFKRERAARIIQAHARGYQARALVKRLQAEKAARLLRFSAAVYVNLIAVRLQRAYRKARAIALFKAKIDRLVLLQRWWRARLQRLSYLRVRYLVCLVQRRWRERLAVKKRSAAKIQAVVRSFLAKRTAERRKEAILIIQSAWRGYSVRKRFNATKFKKVRQRILVANSNVTEHMKLCNRTRSALDYLLKCKNLTTVREAFLHLEVASRLSHKCTEQLVMDNALCVIFKVVRNSNRSLAHMGLIKLALDIFINVSKWATTKDAVVTKETNSLDTLIELACIFREKHEIFLKVMKLLTILCGNEEIRVSLLSVQKAVHKIKSIFTLTKRKHDFEMKRNTAKAKRLRTQNTKKPGSGSTVNPLSAVTTLIETLRLDF